MNVPSISGALSLAAAGLASAAAAKFVLEKAFGLSLDGFKARRRVRVTMHHGAFSESRREAFFVTVTNLSASRDVELSHVWLETAPPVFFIRPERQLPHRLKPDESWETWVYRNELPNASPQIVLHLGRVRLSTGVVLKSRPNRSVPEAGYVPGGPIDGPN